MTANRKDILKKTGAALGLGLVAVSAAPQAAQAAEAPADVTAVRVDTKGTDPEGKGILGSNERAALTVDFNIPNDMKPGDVRTFTLSDGYQPQFSGAVAVNNADGVKLGEVTRVDGDTLHFTAADGPGASLLDRKGSFTVPLGGDLEDGINYGKDSVEIKVNNKGSGVSYIIPGRDQPTHAYATMYGFPSGENDVTFGPVAVLGSTQSDGGPVQVVFELPDAERTMWNPEFIKGLNPNNLNAFIDNDLNTNDTSQGGQEGRNVWETNWGKHVTSAKFVDGKVIFEVDQVPAGWAMRTQLPNSAVLRTDAGKDTENDPYITNATITTGKATHKLQGSALASSVLGEGDGRNRVPKIAITAYADKADANTEQDAVKKEVTNKAPEAQVHLTADIPNPGETTLKNPTVTLSTGQKITLEGVSIAPKETYKADLGNIKLPEGVHKINVTVADESQKVSAEDPVVVVVTKLTAPVNTAPDSSKVRVGQEATVDLLANDESGKYKLDPATVKITADNSWTAGENGTFTRGEVTATDLGGGKIKFTGLKEGDNLTGLSYTVANELGDISAATPIVVNVFDYHISLKAEVGGQDANTAMEAYKVVIPVGQDSTKQMLKITYTNPGKEPVTPTEVVDQTGKTYPVAEAKTLAPGETAVLDVEAEFMLGSTELQFSIKTSEGVSATDPVFVNVVSQGVGLKAMVDGQDANTSADAVKVTVPHNQDKVQKDVALTYDNPGTDPVTVTGFTEKNGATYTLDEPVTLQPGESKDFTVPYEFKVGENLLEFSVVTEQGVTAMDPVVVTVEQEVAPLPPKVETPTTPVVVQEKPAVVQQQKPTPVKPNTGIGYTVEVADGQELADPAGETLAMGEDSAAASVSPLLMAGAGLGVTLLAGLGFAARRRM